MIDPKDIIRSTTLEELNASTQTYFAAITNNSHLFRKPFSDLREAPDLLINLGYLLQGLQLGVSMTVLELAAGSCWLSRYLAELRCAVIACDVSPTALKIGHELFQKRSFIDPPIKEPSFN